MSTTRSRRTWPTPSSFADGVVHRVPRTPEQARRWIEGKEAIGIGRGEPMVDKDGRLIEHHGWPEDQRGHLGGDPWGR